MNAATTRTEIGLVLQGGGALGAYEFGAVTALLELIEQATAAGRSVGLKAVTGVSIGAVNAACIVGALDLADSRRRLSDLWEDLMIKAPSFWPTEFKRDLSFYGLPHFYALRPDLFAIASWTYIYDTEPLLGTLSCHIDFERLNANETGLAITAADVEKGVLKRFANRSLGAEQATRIGPRHVLASASLPPQFPWVEIEEDREPHRYWDGGIVDNTPLGDAIGAFSGGLDVTRLLVIMNLFPLEARPPHSLLEVAERVDQLRFGNRLLQDKANAERINDLVSTVEALVKLVPSPLPSQVQEGVDRASALKLVTPIEIPLTPKKSLTGDYGFRDFSREGVETRRTRGYTIARERLLPYFQKFG